jgi:hypothetical protein
MLAAAKEFEPMWRALFVALGFYCCLLGVECLAVEKAVLADRQEPTQGFGRLDMRMRNRELIPPDWAPWSLMSTGAVTMLYTITIPKRVGGGGH